MGVPTCSVKNSSKSVSRHVDKGDKVLLTVRVLHANNSKICAGILILEIKLYVD